MNSTNKNRKNCIRTLAGCLTILIALTSIPFCSVSAETVPTLNIKDATVQEEDLVESRRIGVELAFCENTEGFLAVSFGIQYDENLTYVDTKTMSSTGEAFQVVCNPEQRILWFSASGGDVQSVASKLQDETIAMLYFDLAETAAADGTEIKGGNFPLQFLWEGLDNSQAFWYTDTQTNKIDAICENSLDGKISFFNPDSELISESDIRLSPGYQRSLEVLNAGGDILWFSSDDSVAIVDENGLVTAVAPGECQIHAFINEHIFSCNVSVTSEVYHLISDNGAVNITDQTTTHIMEYPGALGKVNWMSVKPSIVSIDPDGTMHAKDNGVVNILGTYNGKTLMRIVNVELSSSEPMTEPETTTEPITESDSNEFLGKPQSGDVNGDGETNIVDVVLCNRIYVGVEYATPEQIQAGDMDNSGKLDLSDSMTILKILVGLITVLV
ncbi:MAG: Ig-like domain-containing protein [Oscillospiraceae bacterium]|nr:Ig-like domain-containing protein [Oscillospiraceae bacterium]